MFDPTQRFTRTVEYYSKYRPTYPTEIITVLRDECGFSKDKIVADVGSGTGLLTKLFVDYGNRVYGIEPNQAMRMAAENFFNGVENFHSLATTAEETMLASKSIDFIVIGTAFHWFDVDKAKIEFQRILKDRGWVVMIWNVRNVEKSSLQQDYEKLIIEYGTDYRDTKAHKFEKSVTAEFFAPNEMHVKSFRNFQTFDWEGLQGRLLSTSYSLAPGDLGYDQMLNDLRKIYDKYQENGLVKFEYETMMYYGIL